MTAHSHHNRRELTPSKRGPLWALASTLRFVGRVLRGLLAAVVLLALVAGLPWALVHFVGWPLPDNMPTWDEIQAALLNPMSPQFLLDSLAVLCWIVWFVFALDVLRCAVDAARGITWPQVRPPGPLHGLAAALIGTIVLTLLGNRPPYTAPTPTMAALTSNLAPVAVVAPLTSGMATHTVAHQHEGITHQTTTPVVIDRAAPAPAGMVQVTEEVRLPHDGVYDSLWRVAERIYGPGGGSLWPELFQLNRGVEQPDGRTLTNPNLVRPGWKITAYIPTPPDTRPPDTPQQPPIPPPQPPPTTTVPPTNQPAPNTTPAPAETKQAGEQTNDPAVPGLDLQTGAFVSLGLAGVIAAAIVSARIWRRRRYRIGSGDRADLHRPIAPVVRALRTAHDDHDDRRSAEDVEFVDLAPAPPRIHIAAVGDLEPDEPTAVPARLGVRGGRELAVNLASTRGLGLAGPGATPAARALLLHLLAEHQHGESLQVIVPAADLHLVFDDADVSSLPTTVRVVESLDAALNEMEAALLTCTRRAIEEAGVPPTAISLVLLGSPVPYTERRLQAVLDNGSSLGLAGILLGQWRPGATVHIRHDGAVSATSPGLGDALASTRLFTLPATDATELLAVLHDAEGPADVPPLDHPNTVVAEEPADDRDVAHPSSVPEQPTVEEMTQLETTRPPEPEDSQQGPSRQLLDVHAATADAPPATGTPIPAANIAADDRSPTDVVANPDDAGLVDAPSPHSPEPPDHDEAAETMRGRSLVLRVLGRVELVLHHDGNARELGGALTPKHREMLAYLALHPQGVRREALNDAIWPASRPPRPFNSLHNALSLLRRALDNATDGAISDLILNDDGRYHLDTDLITTDYKRLQHALQTPRSAGGGDTALVPLREAVELYQGDLAEDLTAPWVEPFRESIRRDVLDALGVLIRAHGETDPETMLVLLERTRKLDRYNESVYRDIIRTQARVGRYDAIPRTLAVLATALDDIGQELSSETRNLGEFLQRRGSTRRPISPDNAAAS